MKIPKRMVPPIDWKPSPVEPYWLWRGRRFFWTLGVVGIVCFFGSFLGLAESLWDGVAMAIVGVGLMAGAGGTLALSYEKVPPENEFLVKVILRVGFMAVGPAFFAVLLAMEPLGPETDVKRTVLAATAFCGITVIPFGVSLLKLVLRHRRKK